MGRIDLSVFKPNLTAFGYALFLAINAASVWGGVFPFLPPSFQTGRLVYSFFLAQALAYGLTYLSAALIAYYLPRARQRPLVYAIGAAYVMGWVCLIAAVYLPALAQGLLVAGGALLGVGAAGFYVLWQYLFSGQDADAGNHNILIGTVYSPAIYFALYLIPQAVTMLLMVIVFFPLFCLCLVLAWRRVNASQPMFDDVPRAHPQVYRQALRDYWPSALCIGTLAFGCGVIRALAINGPAMGGIVNATSMVGCFVAGSILLVVWQAKSIRINVVTAYKVAFPPVITSFLLLPLLGQGYSELFAGLLYAVYSCGIVLMMIQCARASRDRGIAPGFIYGFFAGIVYALHDVGFACGSFSDWVTVLGWDPFTVAAVTSIYLMALMFYLAQGGLPGLASRRTPDAESIELIALNAPDDAPAERERWTRKGEGRPARGASGARGADAGPSTGAGGGHGQYKDRVSKQCALLQRHYRLSDRETEVMELFARGTSIVRIAEELVISENTVKTHLKRIYAKLAVHKKQDLIDLLEEFAPKR